MNSKTNFQKYEQTQRIIYKMESRKIKLEKLKSFYSDSYEKEKFEDVINRFGINPLTENEWTNLFNGGTSTPYRSRFPEESLNFNFVWLDPDQSALTFSFWKNKPYFFSYYLSIFETVEKFIKCDSNGFKKIIVRVENNRGSIQWKDGTFEFKIKDNTYFSNSNLMDVFQYIQKEWTID